MGTGWHIEDIGDERVEFVIGMRWRHLWRLAARPWVPLAFVRMLRSEPGSGPLSSRLGLRPAGPVVVQRWRSREHLDAWARDRHQPHLGPWARFRRYAGRTADWGLWHEMRPAT